MATDGTKKYRVTLTPEERAELEGMLTKGSAAALRLTHARVLLKADQAEGGPGWSDTRTVEALDVGRATVARVRERFVEEGLEAALTRRPPERVYARKLDGRAEAHLVAMACSEPPEGRSAWTMQLLADQMVTRGHVDAAASDETVRRTLFKTTSSRGGGRCGACRPRPTRRS